MALSVHSSVSISSISTKAIPLTAAVKRRAYISKRFQVYLSNVLKESLWKFTGFFKSTGRSREKERSLLQLLYFYDKNSSYFCMDLNLHLILATQYHRKWVDLEVKKPVVCQFKALTLMCGGGGQRFLVCWLCLLKIALNPWMKSMFIVYISLVENV